MARIGKPAWIVQVSMFEKDRFAPGRLEVKKGDQIKVRAAQQR